MIQFSYISPKDAYYKAMDAAKKSLEMDKTLPEAYISLAIVSLYYDWEWTAIERRIRKAIELDSDEILVFGALGERWDMTIANLLLLSSSEFSKVTIRLIDGQQEIFPLRGKGELTFKGKKGDTLSLVPLGEYVEGLTLQGLKYPLKDDVLKFAATRGISNVLLEDIATVYLKKGLLLCIHIRKHKD